MILIHSANPRTGYIKDPTNSTHDNIIKYVEIYLVDVCNARVTCYSNRIPSRHHKTRDIGGTEAHNSGVVSHILSTIFWFNRA
jgi:hypothetical protein